VYPKSKEKRNKQRSKQETKKEQERGSYWLERSGRAGEISVHGSQLASGKLSEVQAESLQQTEERKSWKIQNKRKASSAQQPGSESVCWTSKLKTSREVWSGWWQKLSFLLNYAHNALLLVHHFGHSVCPLKTFIFSRMEWSSTPVHYIFMVAKAPAYESLRLGQASQCTQHNLARARQFHDVKVWGGRFNHLEKKT
jgi:hypothetical protein